MVYPAEVYPPQQEHWLKNGEVHWSQPFYRGYRHWGWTTLQIDTCTLLHWALLNRWKMWHLSIKDGLLPVNFQLTNSENFWTIGTVSFVLGTRQYFKRFSSASSVNLPDIFLFLQLARDWFALLVVTRFCLVGASIVRNVGIAIPLTLSLSFLFVLNLSKNLFQFKCHYFTVILLFPYSSTDVIPHKTYSLRIEFYCCEIYTYYWYSQAHLIRHKSCRIFPMNSEDWLIKGGHLTLVVNGECPADGDKLGGIA